MVADVIPPGAVIGLWTALTRISIVILIPCGELHTIVKLQTVAYIEEKKINKDQKQKDYNKFTSVVWIIGIVRETGKQMAYIFTLVTFSL